MREPTYRDALAHAWEISTQHKLLWLFGFFAVFLGQLGVMDLVVQMTLAERNFAWYPLFLTLKSQAIFLWQSFVGLNLSVGNSVWLVSILVLLVGMLLLLGFAAVVSQGALIHGIHQSLSVIKRKHIDISLAWHKGIGHFWRLFGLTFLKKSIVGVFTISLGLALFNVISNGKDSGETLVFLFLFVLVAIVGSVTSLLTTYAAGYVVIENYSFVDALHEAWYLFREHWLVSIEIAAIVFLLNVVLTGAVLGLGFFFLIEMAMLWALAVVLQSSLLWGALLFLGSLLFLIAIACIGSIFTVFSTSIWTYLFVVMHKKGIKSRLLHLFGK